ncbi:addiction module protein [Cyclobacterium sp. 1_MG-2023]|jgi:putative addiction module component (TIGR02574 family)|uniref:addiction module protein n=1 Tax=Cyclobacterium sp. 1_MG-2023 TaxID=3062681 RepID=UPI0026E47CC1|nr:addiction module protein [Cyclobacterium sp. 1_MG-2023]MDO6438192.1 addiction module protein [Cyclobacterium sp. 1_MG-2023]|tara:strand:+ start:58 stop:279 length:222 start_codon:yes stop_codon:yes gene_type:complete
MDIQSIKVDLIHWITKLDDRKVLEQMQAYKDRQEEGLSKAHKALLDERIASYEKDPSKVLDWDDVMKDIENGQ